MSVDDWNVDDTLNNTLEGVDVSEGMLPGPLNDVIRKIAAAIKVFRNKSYCIDKNVTFQASGGALPVSVQVGHLLMEY